MKTGLERCPWCPNTGGCSDCSLSGEPLGNYTLLTASEHERKVRVLHLQWAAVLTGVLISAALAVAAVVVWFTI